MVLSCLFICSLMISCGEEVKHTLLTYKSGGETYVYSVSDKRLSEVPEWKSVKSEMPLSINKACSEAEKWMTKTYQDTQYDLKYVKLEYDLCEIQGSQTKVWHFEISFQSSARSRKKVLVLLDGSIVEPNKAKNN